MYDKPGCFGNAITYNVKSSVCQECEEASACRVAARQRIEELRPMVSVDSILRMAHTKPQKLSDRLPESAHSLLAKMNSRQRRAVGVLMSLSTPTPSIFVNALMSVFEAWTKTEAVLIAKETISLLVNNRLADIEDGRILLRF
jgi:hypothetical protein